MAVRDHESSKKATYQSGNKKDISICANCNVWDEVKGEEIISPEFAEKVSILNSDNKISK